LELKWVVLIIFALTYAYVIFAKRWRTVALMIGVVLMCAAAMIMGDPEGWLSLKSLVVNASGGYAAEDGRSAINWNIIGIFAGTMILGEYFTESRVPVLLADVIVQRVKRAGMALLWICVLSSFISIFVANVATVLIVAPVGLAVSRRLKISPVPFIIGLAVSANLQGMATLVGDPPSMLLANAEHMTFNDFFFMHGKPGIFFATQIGAVASFGALWMVFRPFKQPSGEVPETKVTSWVPTILMVCMLITLASPLGNWLDPKFAWFGGATTMFWGVVGTFWALRHHGRKTTWTLLKRFDFSSTFFLIGVFVMAYAMDAFGHVASIADWISGLVGSSLAVAFLVIVAFSVMVSAFLDNIPYTALMLPVVASLSVGMPDGTRQLLAFGLLVGACLGGNITPVGAAANVVGVGILKREGHLVSFWDFARIGLPFTIAATVAGSIFLWLVWAP